MPRKRKDVKENNRRPWLLGTNDIPPPLRVPWQMWSQSSDPHQQGLVQFEFTEEGLGVGWCPEGYLDKDVIPWHELAWLAGSEHPDLTKECEFIKEKAETEGYKLGLERAIEEVRNKVWDIEADKSDNPFLKKYGADLKKVVEEMRAKVEAMR